MRLLTLILVFFLASCTFPPSPGPEPEPPNPPVEPATCEGFCEHGETLGCEWTKPSPEGTTCVEVCESVQNSGIVTWDLECRVAAKSCEEVDQCER